MAPRRFFAAAAAALPPLHISFPLLRPLSLSLISSFRPLRHQTEMSVTWREVNIRAIVPTFIVQKNKKKNKTDVSQCGLRMPNVDVLIKPGAAVAAEFVCERN